MAVNIIAVLWGFAEATLFFIVPDVWLSAVGVNNLRRGMIACGFALVGALVGGSLMYFYGANDVASARELLGKIPAINSEMLQRVSSDLKQEGIMAIFLGPLSGTPYKTYAIQSSEAGIGYLFFLLISIPSRLIRFLIVTSLCHYVLNAIYPKGKENPGYIVLALGWASFYTFYFVSMS